MWTLPEVAEPVTFVVFGATGDLFARKIIPSLYLLYTEGKLPEVFSVIGFGRAAHTTESFREHVFVQLKHTAPGVSKSVAEPFLGLFEYHRGEFHDSASFKTLGEAIARRDAACQCVTVKSFYLAVPPEQVPILAPHISEVAPKSKKARRIIIEKPFGKDEASARELSDLLHRFFDEKELFRIDHYLAKPALDTLLHARTKHKRYDALLRSEPIADITITLFETLGVEKRGAFYDRIGALRDVGQNHLLEMLALAVMPIPEIDAMHVCRARETFMGALPRLKKAEITAQTLRGQYSGYQSIDGVTEASATETYFRVGFMLEAPPYTGVPVTLQSGKRMREMQKDIVISFHCEHTDSLHIELEPLARIYTKKGDSIDTIAEFIDPEPNIQYANEYASLFMHAWANNMTYFPTEKEVEYQWRFVDPVLEAWGKGAAALHTYPQGWSGTIETWTPQKQSASSA